MANNNTRCKTLSALPFMVMFGFAASVNATTWYVDSSATGSKNGTSWTNAWTNVNQIAGVSGGDTVYISGGPTGTSRTYSLTASWQPRSGTSGHPITYQIAKDSSHNGTAIFNTGSNSWISGAINYVVVSGDAGDAGRHFQLVSNSSGAAVDASGSTGLRLAYVVFNNSNGSFAHFNGGTQIELDHVYFYKISGSSGDDDHAIYFGVDGNTWDVNKIHDSVFYLPRNDAGGGDDCIQGGDGGISIYNNSIIGYAASYPRGQHQDGFQPLGGSYLKVYSNYIQDMANYAVFGDAYYGDFAHFWVYNNIVVLTSSALQASDPPQGIAIGPDGGSLQQLGRWPTFTDVMVANNLIADYRGHGSINLRNNPGQGSSFSQCSVINNIIINSDGIGVGSSVTATPNIVIALSSGSGHFVRYTPSASNNDFHLLAVDTTFRGKGTALSSYFSSDKDGKLRAPTGVWDVGPYVYSVYNAPPPPANLRVVKP